MSFVGSFRQTDSRTGAAGSVVDGNVGPYSVVGIVTACSSTSSSDSGPATSAAAAADSASAISDSGTMH